MCEAIILSIAFLGCFLIGSVVGALCAYRKFSDSDNMVVTPSGNKIQLWKSMISPGVTYVACNMDKNDKWLDGDYVTFDKNGRIDYIRTSWMTWRREEE